MYSIDDHWVIATSWWSPNSTTPGRDSGKWISRIQLTTLLTCNWKGAGEEEEEEEDDYDDDEYAEEVEGGGKDSTALSSVKRGRDREEEEADGHEDAKKVKA
jgi:hypothetical protein